MYQVHQQVTDACAADEHIESAIVTPENIQPYPKAAARTGKLWQGMENQNSG